MPIGRQSVPVDPVSIIRLGARWEPGAWTPARCELWRQMGPEMKKRLEVWVMAEHTQNRCHKTQLPLISVDDVRKSGV